MIVLIVDDDPQSCVAMANQIRSLDGVRVVAFEQAERALAWLNAHNPDLILVDYQMPGSNGVDIIRWVRSRGDGFDVPMLMLAGEDDGKFLDNAVEAGVNDFIRKPVHQAELIARTRGMLKLRAKTKELIDALCRLQEMATTDSLTGTYNRRFFFERLDEEVKRACRHKQLLSVMMIDIDHFKSINDSFGHGCGDRVLATMAATVKDQLRAHDFVGRLGGEEFSVALPETGIEGAQILADRIRRVIESSVVHATGSVRMTVSIGVAQLNYGEAADDILARADDALYAAKRGGRNRVIRSEACLTGAA